MFKKKEAARFGLKKCHDPEHKLLDVVFVHGLTGDRENTWRHSSGMFWPESMLKNDLPEARILTFGYDADVAHFWSSASQNRVGNHAQNLLNSITQLRERSETTDRPVIFVAHSLGGLVVEDAILASKNSGEPHLQQLIQCVVGIAFLGTPHCGSDIARWAKIFGSLVDLFHKTNHHLLETLKPDSEVLARIQKEFHTMLRVREPHSIDICCFYEELPVKGVGEIVPMHSAILPAYNSIGIHNNHMDMTKFDGEDDPGYQAVSTELWRWAKKAKANTAAVQNDTVNSNEAQANQSNVGYGSNQTHKAGETEQKVSDEEKMRLHQSGNHIANNQAGGKAVQGNNISAQGNITLNF